MRALLFAIALSIPCPPVYAALGCSAYDPGVGNLVIAVTEAQALVTADLVAQDQTSYVRDMVLLGRAVQEYVTAIAHLADDTTPLGPGDPSPQCCLVSQAVDWTAARNNTLIYVRHYQNSLSAGIVLFDRAIVTPSIQQYAELLNLMNLQLSIFETLEFAQCN